METSRKIRALVSNLPISSLIPQDAVWRSKVMRSTFPNGERHTS